MGDLGYISCAAMRFRQGSRDVVELTSYEPRGLSVNVTAAYFC